jgi:hypothetical protein
MAELRFLDTTTGQNSSQIVLLITTFCIQIPSGILVMQRTFSTLPGKKERNVSRTENTRKAYKFLSWIKSQKRKKCDNVDWVHLAQIRTEDRLYEDGQ